MSRQDRAEYNRILRQVKDWPLERRISLVQDILLTIVPLREPVSVQPRQPTWHIARGLLRPEGAVPSDADIRLWREEHRLEKYS